MAIDALSAANSAAAAKANAANTNNNTNTDNNTKPAQSTADTKSATLNYDSFLKLLVAQMKNQDPTDPVDASTQMAQLASFSNVEQAIKTNKHLENLIQETSLTQATALIGKTVTSADGETSGVVASVEINSDGLTAILKDGSKVTIQTGITVASSTVVATPGDGDTTPTDGDTTPDDGKTTPTDSTGE
jgi:flagellar basal-body rod modification protein FlgD